jgi:hypothetical protein
MTRGARPTLYIRLLACLAFGLISLDSHAQDNAPASPAIRAAVAKSLPLLQEGARQFRERSEGRCIACHHQGLILTTVALARKRGLKVSEDLAKAEVDRVHGFYARRRQRYLKALSDPAAAPQADPYGNFTVHAGYWLWGLAAEQVAQDEALATTARLLAARQESDGRWTFTDTARAPLQASDVTTTALAAFAISRYGPPESADEYNTRQAAAKRWLVQAAPRTLDESAFRLLGLEWTGATLAEKEIAAKPLLATRRSNGAWAQQENMPTDAYATGLALVALHQAGSMPVNDPAYQRGVEYLIRSQLEDGSWFVRTRAIPSNPYFESGFPHGKSQFISYAASCWATQALLLALPIIPPP